MKLVPIGILAPITLSSTNTVLCLATIAVNVVNAFLLPSPPCSPAGSARRCYRAYRTPVVPTNVLLYHTSTRARNGECAVVAVHAVNVRNG
ncbi:hypothetical protein B9Z19DRAFT_1072749 [Tuber borchii]|uniref:Uncharacterized protein n=1 Tax=Tuber borchii TaxID=42251 RepID=A0A2T7A6K9_TUBBO|nr:hypothetical protein B9Z19DRAFT_1072749 [Tuber borchii]